MGKSVKVLLCLLVCAVAASGRMLTAANLPTLTRIEQIRRLTPEDAARAYPTRIRGVVTYYDVLRRDLFIQDSTAGIWVDSDYAKPDLHVGEFVEVEGVSGVGDFAPEIDRSRFRNLGEAPMPKPARPSSDELVSGRQDSQWVEVEGLVRSVSERDGGLVLSFFAGAFECKVLVLKFPTPRPEIIDAHVLIHGVFSGLYDSVSNRFIGFQILTPSWNNLLVNAAHAVGDVMKETGKKGKISLHTRMDGSMALIAIADTGGGIPEGIRNRIFDPFFTTKEVGRGTGQGLAIARSVVVDRHKGSLAFESDVGKGTTFYVRLPLESADLPKAAKPVVAVG
jgi:hypothetical protein